MRKAIATVVRGTIRGISLCRCGHIGDVSTRLEMTGKGEPVQHAGAIGHGRCLAQGCRCTQFTWKAHLKVRP